MFSNSLGRQVGAKDSSILSVKFYSCIGSYRVRIFALGLFTILAMTAGILVVCLTSFKTTAICQSTFERTMKSSLVSSSQPRCVTVGDFNNDYQMDIAVANSGTDTIGIFLAENDGTFSNQQILSLESESRPYSIVATDFNNDNYLDIAVANYGINCIGIFLGNGDATFLDQKKFSTGSSRPLFITIGDFNKDNRMDIVVVNYGTDNIGISFGYGNGSFQEQIFTYSTGYDSFPYSLAVGYLNNDNYLDIAVANYGTNNIGILLGHGNGTFVNQKTYTTTPNSNPCSIALGDFNNDNQSDIAVTNNATGTIGILLNYGNGTFLAQTTYAIGTNTYPQGIATGDFNKDNKLDIAIIDSNNDQIHILPGYGNGRFDTISTYDEVSDSSPMWIVVADFNKDNQSDIAVANYGSNNVLILTNYSLKPSTRQSNNHVGAPSVTGSVVVNDVNNDHIYDLVCIVDGNIYIRTGLDDGSFANGIMFSTGTNSIAKYIWVGDLNHDNRSDVVSVNSGSNNVGVFIGNGDGTLATMMNYSTGIGSSPRWAAVIDVNNDNRLDIVSANTGTNTVGVLLGIGNGTFTTVVLYSTGTGFSPSSVAVGDINNDTYLDIVVANSISGITFLLGYGNGTFLLMTTYSTGENSSPFWIALVDLNNDSYLDIVVTNTYASNIGVFLAYGNGTFSAQTSYSTGADSTPYYATVTDFNNDHINDLAVTDQNNDEIVILYGYHNGSFELSREYSTGSGSKPYGITFINSYNNKPLEIVVSLYGTGDIAILTEYYAAEFANLIAYSTGSASHPFSVAVGDFNNDNRTDIVIANSGTDNFDILLSSSNGTFGTKITYPIDIGSYPQYVITCDINQDNQLDIMSTNSKGNSISVILGHGDGTFAKQNTYSTGTGSQPYAIAYNDFNNDHRLDLAVVNAGSDSLGIFYGFNYTSFQNQVTYSNINSSKPTGIIVRDFNKDTFLDIAVVFSNNNNLGILFGYGNGSFNNTILYSTGNGSQPNGLAADDFNNDGLVDIVVVNIGTNNIGVLLGYGNSSFSMIKLYSTGEGSTPYAIAVEDFNNDSRLDIVVANYGTDNVAILFGYGNGTFSIIQTYSTGKGSTPRAVTVGDFDEDGLWDIAVACFGTSNVVILHGYANGTFGDQLTFSTGSNSKPTWIVIDHFDKDKHLDIVTANYGTNNIGILFGYGNGSFTTVAISTTGPGSLPTCISVNDFNNDKKLDLAVANFGTNNIVILFGFGDGSFLLGTAYSTDTGSSPYALANGDFNNDSQLDIAVTNSASNNIGIFVAYDSQLFGSMTIFATGHGSKPYSVAIGDFNHDNQSDIAVANYGADNVAIFRGYSNGQFILMTPYATGSGSAPYSVVVGNFNNDSYLDIVVSNSGTNNIAILLGLGNGTLTLGMTYSTGDRSLPYTVAIGDFDNNKISDIVVANSGTSNIFLLYGYGNVTFGNKTSYALGYGYHPYSVAVADINRDNWMDIVIACYDTDHVEILIKAC